ncbi:hypothetical protein NR477_001310 [Klebsiella pneumoniae]
MVTSTHSLIIETLPTGGVFAFLGGAMQQPYFFNPGMTTQQLEDWLGQQKTHLAHFNHLVAEKAALEERLKEIDKSIELLSSSGFEGTLSFPYSSSPLLENPQTEKQPKAD